MTSRRAERRRKVLVADDNVLVLEKASAILAREFDLVAAVTDGQQALDAALRLDPDVTVLDVSMPKADGLQIARELRRSGSRAKIVMLTMHELDDFVAAAIDSGAQGYVLKTRMQSDLASAIDHVIAGRLFTPSLTSLFAIAPAADASRHAVQLRVNDRAYVDQLSALLAAALRRGDVVAICATDATRAAIEQRLIATGCDIAQAASRRTYVWTDFTDALFQMMASGRLDTRWVAAKVGELERSRLAAGAPHLTIVGEMSPQLCRDGHPEAAIQLEHVWDDLTRSLPFLTVCFYPMECFSEAGDPGRFQSICAPHSAVCHALDA